MIITNKLLEEYESNYFISIPLTIKKALLKRYGKEPSNTMSWSSQDIHEAIRKHLSRKDLTNGN
jgi:hypothetical protein